MWLGLGLWLVYGALLVAVRGVRWDENYEFVQVLTGAISYPEWHPLTEWARRLFSVQVYVSAILLKLFPGPVVLNATRNVLFIWMTLVPAYLLGCGLGRRALTGHVAAVLTAAGVHLAFDGSYPQFLWPGMFSNGHIGTGFAVATIALLAAGNLRAGGFMAGVLPAVHLGQFPPLLIFLPLYTALQWSNGDRKGLRRAGLAFAAGLTISAAIWAGGKWVLREDPVTVAASVDAGDVHEVWAGWVQHHDMHRQPPAENFHVMVLLFVGVTLVGVASRKAEGHATDRTWTILTLYGACILAIVYGVIALQSLFGDRLPYVVQVWLPYRVGNHLHPILIAMTVATLMNTSPCTGKRTLPGAWLVAAGMAYLVARPFAIGWASNGTWTRYIDQPEAVLFGLSAAAFVVRLADVRRRGVRLALIGGGVVVWVSVAFVHQFGAAFLFLGAVGGLLVAHSDPVRSVKRNWTVTVSGLVVLFGLSLLWREHRNYAWLPVGDFERAVTEQLAAAGEPDALLVGPPEQVLLQAQTGHPVLVDLATPFFIGYRPDMGPAINKMYQDVYGRDLRKPADGPRWMDVWRSRSPEEWRRLSERYAFDYVVAPNSVQVDLPIIVRGETRRLYKIQP